MTEDLRRRLEQAAERCPAGRPDLTQVLDKGRRSKRRRQGSILLGAVALVGLGAFVVGDLGFDVPEAQRSTGASGYVTYRDRPGLFQVTYPESWSRAEDQLTALGNPNELLVLATGELERGGGCAPTGSLAAADPSDAIVFMVEFPGVQEPRPARRPRSFDALPPAEFDDCWDAEVSTFEFLDSGSRFHVDVWLGEAATKATSEEILAVLNSLQFDNRSRKEDFFTRADRLLRERRIGFLRLADDEKPSASKAELRAAVMRRLQREEPDARLLEVVLAEFVPTSERIHVGRSDGIMYVVRTGPFDTGDCLDLYNADTLDYEMGSCFVTEREL